MIKYPLIALSFIAFFIYNGNDDILPVKKDEPEKELSKSFKEMDFSSLRETVYTFEPYFIEVNLETQKGFLFSREGLIKEFGVSSGNKKLLDAVDTKEGLFVIQSKLVKWHSRQFDSTLMLNWMGFNYGIGFHALLGNSYYKYLGVKKSSHGCLRISREDAKEIYSLIDFGTPVLVHSGNNAVYVGFADSVKFYEYQYHDFNSLEKVLTERYKEIYDGFFLINDHPKLLIGSKNITHVGLPIGDRNKIPKRQLIKPYSLYVESAIPDKMKLEKIHKKNVDSLLTIELN